SVSVCSFHYGLNTYLNEFVRLNSTQFPYVTARTSDVQYARDYFTSLGHLITELREAVHSLGEQTPQVATSRTWEASSDIVYMNGWHISNTFSTTLKQWKSLCPTGNF
ncbi:hypothetical protein Bpfe_024124, partial [Biomphalaria pfeifferi]